MARILSHPFRLSGNSVATVEQDSDAGHSEQLLVLLTTRRGERSLVPTFGVSDPAFGVLDVAEARMAAALHGPPVQVLAVKARVTSATTQEVEVEYAFT